MQELPEAELARAGVVRYGSKILDFLASCNGPDERVYCGVTNAATIQSIYGADLEFHIAQIL